MSDKDRAANANAGDMDFLKMLQPKDALQLVINWQENLALKGTQHERDFTPVVRLFNPVGAGTWLLTELEENSSLAFGLCDLGAGCPELGYVCLEELWTTRLFANMKIEQDLHFRPKMTLSEYARKSRSQGYI